MAPSPLGWGPFGFYLNLDWIDMVNPKPVSFVTGISGANPKFAPEPLEVVGGIPAASVPAATTSTNGTVKRAAAQANSTATDVAGLVTDFNALLAKLRTAGILAP